MIIDYLETNIIKTMIEARDISKQFGQKVVLKKINFTIDRGEIVGLLGENGVGKTTLMRILTGYLSPTSGKIFFSDREMLKKDQHKIGYLPENNPLYSEMRVCEYLSFIAGVKGVSNKRERIGYVIEKTHIKEKFSEIIGELSKGYKQRVGLAAALISDPEILILDEPSSGLDPNQARHMRELIQEIGQEKTVIFSSHVLSEVEQVSKRIIIMHDHHIVFDSSDDNQLVLNEVEVTIDGPVKEIINVFGDHDQVEKLFKVGRNKFVFGSVSKYLEKTIFNECAHKGWTILEMKRRSDSLEQLFIDITRKKA